MDIKELTNEEISDRAEYLINKFDKLNIIYLRVSTKNEGQEEMDQLPDIIKTFNLDVDKCLIITARESAYQKKKDKYRKFNIIIELISKYKDYDKTLYVWDLDRIYRNQDKQTEFILYLAKKFNCSVLSYSQEFLHRFKEMDGLGKAMYNFMIEVFAWKSERESYDIGRRLKKSLTYDESIGKFKTNKGNIYGRKLLKKILNQGKKNEKKIYYTQKELELIDNNIIRLRDNQVPYKKIVSKFALKGIKISEGYINNVMKKRK